MGIEIFQRIVQSVRHPVQQPVIEDRLVWTQGKKGRFTVKEGYKVMTESNLVQPVYGEQKLKALKNVWKWKGVLPRVRMFVWRALHDGLTTAAELAKRIRTMSPRCTRCDLENEYTMHLLFFCPLSQATWFISRFALRVESLPLQFAEALLFIEGNLQTTQIPYFCNMLWCLWKARNKELFAGKKTTPQAVLVQVAKMEIEATEPAKPNHIPKDNPVQVMQGEIVILADGSWDTQGRGGMGMAVYNRRGDLVFMHFKPVPALDALHAEALAVLTAMKYVRQGGCRGNFIIFSDSKNLVQVTNDGDISELASWKAAETAMSAIMLLEEEAHKMQLKYITRRAMLTPHNLANWARKSGRSGEGTPLQCMVSHLEIEQLLNKNYFTTDAI